MGFGTAQSIISDAAIELGLVSAAVADPFGSADPLMVLLRTLLKSAGQEIIREKAWTQAQNEFTFVTVANQSTYPLPADFLRMVAQTGWNRTSRWPLGNPLDEWQWQALKGLGIGLVWNVLFRPRQGKLSIYPDTNTPGGYTIAFEYLSNWFVAIAAAPTTPANDAPANNTDVILFDSYLMVKALKRAFLRNKGFDSSVADDEYSRALELAMAADAPARVLRLDRSAAGSPSPLAPNLPLTGWGS